MRRFMWMVVLSLLIAAALACDAPGAAPTLTPAPVTVSGGVTLTPSPPTTEAPTLDPTDIPGARIVVLEVVDQAEPGAFFAPEEGERLVGVRVVIENQGAGPLPVNPLNAHLEDDEGTAHSAELGASNEYEQIATLDLLPGERVEGWMFFAVPEDATPARLAYSGDLSGGEDAAVDLAEQTVEWTPLEPAADLPGINEPSTYLGYTLTAFEVVDPAPAGALYTPVEGYRLVAVEVKVGNERGASPLSVNPLYLYLVDHLGFVHAVQLGAANLRLLGTRAISAGDAVRGYVAFVIPEGREPSYLRYAVDVFESAEGMAVRLGE